jgi:arginyl-tRNA synthetase
MGRIVIGCTELLSKPMLKEIVHTKLAEALDKLGVSAPSIEITVPEKAEFGDLSTNLAFTLKSTLKASPREIGLSLLEHVDKTPFDKVEVVGPGFLNFFLKREYILNVLERVLSQNASYGRLNLGRGKKAQVEWVSANPTGPLHIGHSRQAILGDVISRLLEDAGYELTREYYFNDAGQQMRRLGNSVKARYLQSLGHSVVFPEDGYQGEYIAEIAQKIQKEHGAHWQTADAAQFKEFAESALFAEIKQTLARLFRVPHEKLFDLYYNETWLYGEPDQTRVFVNNSQLLDLLRTVGLAYEKDGAVWLRATAQGRPEDRVLVRSKGERDPTYRLPDIAYHVNKLLRGFDLVIDIFGADHQDTYQDVLAAIRGLYEHENLPKACSPDKIRVLIHQMVNVVRGGKPVKMSKRHGTSVTIDELIDELKSTVELDEAAKHCDTQTEEQLKEDFAVNVVRYFILMRSLTSHVNFDLDLAKVQSKENPVYYIMYAYTRISAIRDKYSQANVLEHNHDLLKEKEELALLKKLDSFPETVRETTEQLAPQFLTNYAYELARLVHDFYEKHRVISDDAARTAVRVRLLAAVQCVLGRCFELLGLKAPERM